MILLAEKLRSNYSSLPDNKEQVLEELLSSVDNAAKRNRLLEAMKKTVERKGESLVGGQSNQEIAFVVQKMLRWSTTLLIKTTTHFNHFPGIMILLLIYLFNSKPN